VSDAGADEPTAVAPALPEGVLAVRLGPGANCSSAGSAIDVLFYGSVIAGALAVALAAALPLRERRARRDDDATRGASETDDRSKPGDAG
jgi:hypothetical protein